MKIRKIFAIEELVFRDERGVEDGRLSRVTAVAVVENPLAGSADDDLSVLFDYGAELGAMLADFALKRLDGAPTSYGKGAIVGSDGSAEHGAAILHPRLGKPVRAAIGGGKALMPSNVKVGGIGAVLDLPIGHKDDPWLFDYIDTITIGLPDAPRSNEIAVYLGLANGGRPRARSGSGPS
ncbi:amino acid synthesis family protein [Roseibacterium sp. SDUM158016]|uniref:amino acid synthesis family protein n=1 Tax=Roseicyclus sediminis TaxID=2980997 RepID=UPI0021D3293B|nr:amino acid synthesis family protein [Roseibacterium sp. SDUM158016]MCU4652643.1 amino acid synthesis family protein [Roseibacterium sp. SDUM158016]